MKKDIRKWYKKKRFIIPIALVGLLIFAAAIDEGGNNSTQQSVLQSQVNNQGQNYAPTTPSVNVDPVTTPDTESVKLKITKPSNPEEPDYYINSAGNKVQSPTYYDSRPAGASAKCRDGTYSFSQSRRGTCSHHGGVAVWY